MPPRKTISAEEVGSPEHQAIGRYWEWYSEMEKRHPTPYRPVGKAQAAAGPPTMAEDLYPLCACGRPRERLTVSKRAGGLFGGPFQRTCPVCEARRQVEDAARMAPTIWRGRDDEDILDLLYQTFPRAFELGVLPDYWYELQRGKRQDDESKND